jgi:hypothetical protein
MMSKPDFADELVDEMLRRYDLEGKYQDGYHARQLAEEGKSAKDIADIFEALALPRERIEALREYLKQYPPRGAARLRG